MDIIFYSLIGLIILLWGIVFYDSGKHGGIKGLRFTLINLVIAIVLVVVIYQIMMTDCTGWCLSEAIGFMFFQPFYY